MKVLFYQKLNSIWEEGLAQLNEDFVHSDFYVSTNPDVKLIREAEVIVGGVIPIQLLEQAAALKLVIVPFVGVDHLPLQLFRERGVRVANSHGNSESVAERALGLILAFYGNIITYHNDLKMGKWHGFWVGRGLDDSWESIYGKSCSIIGAGEIGKSLAGLLRAFHVTVTGFKKNKIVPVPDVYDTMLYDFNEAVNRSEIIVNILPLTGETKNIFNAETLSMMKDKVFVNVGRGGTVDEEALYTSLKNGTLKGAALDTWFQYPQDGKTTGWPSVYPYQDLDNVVLSPHTAGFTRQAARENIKQAVANVSSFIKTGTPVNEVDVSAGY